MKNKNNKSSEVVNQSLEKILLKIKNSYNYLDIDDITYNSIISEEVKKMDIKTPEDIKKIEKNIYNKFDDIVYQELENNEEMIITNFLNNRINTCNDDAGAYRNYNILFSFLKKYDHNLNDDTIINIIKNNKLLSKTLKKIYEKNKKRLLSGQINDEFLESLLNAYCLVNNIEIDEEINANFDSDISDEGDISTTKKYIQEINKIPLLTANEERELFLRLKKGDELAKKEIIERNLRLVVYIATKIKSTQLSLEDKIQDGNLGLIKAIDKFDIEKNYKFSTYATWWIKQSIIRGIESNDRNIRIPAHVHADASKIRKVNDYYLKEYNREATLEEIAEELNIKISKVNDIKNKMLEEVSLNSLVGDDKDTELVDFIPTTQQFLEDDIIDENIRQDFRKLFKEGKLTSREKNILILRYGLDDSEPQTLETIGRLYGITRERIRQIQNKALNKLRSNPKIESLVDYMDNPKKCLDNVTPKVENKPVNLIKEEPIIKEIKEVKEEEKTILGEGRRHMVTRNIYDYFKTYSKKEINDVIKKLNDEDRKLLVKRYGGDLEHPIETKLTHAELTAFYGCLIPKIKRRLEGKKSRTPLPVVKEEPMVKENIVDITTTEEKQELDIKALQSILNIPEVFNSIKELSPKEATIIYLKLGYIDGKKYSTTDISKFLNIPTSEIIETTRNFLMQSKGILSSILEDTISKTK